MCCLQMIRLWVATWLPPLKLKLLGGQPIGAPGERMKPKANHHSISESPMSSVKPPVMALLGWRLEDIWNQVKPERLWTLMREASLNYIVWNRKSYF